MKKIFLLTFILLLFYSVAAQTLSEKSYVLDLKYTLKSDSFELMGIEIYNSGSPNYVLDSADYYFEFSDFENKEKFFFEVPNIVYTEPDPSIDMFDEQGTQIYFPDETDIIGKEEVTDFTLVVPYSENANKLIIKDAKGKEKLSVDLTALKPSEKPDSKLDEPKGKEFDFNRDVLKNPSILPILLIATLIVAILFRRELKNEKQKD
ncbi:MAG: hypothetical protein AABW72_00080 [archaeon]